MVFWFKAMSIKPTKNKIFIIFVLVVFDLAWKLILSNDWPSKTKMFVRNEKVCEPLLQTARDILAGKEIPLPFSKNNTLWKFKERLQIGDLLKNINSILLKHDSVDGKRFNYNFENDSVSTNYVKVRKRFITFGHNCCQRSKLRAVEKALTVGGFDDARLFNMSSLALRFCEIHHNVISARRGAGYWLWKPYILLKVLISEDMADGDLVMYQDAGAYFIRSAKPLFKLAHESKSGIVVFSLTLLESKYTKRDAMVLMDMNIPEIEQTDIRNGAFIVVRKSCFAIQFVMEWMAYLSDRRIASDDENTMGLPNAKSFIAHRHDQSVLSLLSKKWGLLAWRDPSQYGNFITDVHYGPYSQLINHDRWKN